MNARAGVVTSQVVWLASLPLTARAPTLEASFKGAAAGFVVAAFASFLPDLDHPGSTIGRYFPAIVRKALGGHRMGAHSLLMVGACWWITGYLLGNPIVANAVALGCSVHIIIDMMTVDGVGVLYPATRQKFRVGWIKTGGAGEDRFVVVMKCVGGLFAVGYGYLLVQSLGV
jgi:inner membrane protein